LLKATRQIEASSAETIGGFNTGFDAVHLHRPPSAETVGAFITEFDIVNLHRPAM
jgi:hypothetical protein